jgi:hypothetical protein
MTAVPVTTTVTVNGAERTDARPKKRETTNAKRRYVVLGGPGGQMTMLQAGSPLRFDSRYRNWVELTWLSTTGKVDRPRLYRIYAAVRRVWELA